MDKLGCSCIEGRSSFSETPFSKECKTTPKSMSKPLNLNWSDREEDTLACLLQQSPALPLHCPYFGRFLNFLVYCFKPSFCTFDITFLFFITKCFYFILKLVILSVLHAVTKKIVKLLHKFL